MIRFHQRNVQSIWLLVSRNSLSLIFLPLSPTISFHDHRSKSSTSFSCRQVLHPSSLTVNLLMTGVEKGYYQFTSHLIAELIRVVSKGSAPGNNLLLDALYSIIALVSLSHSPLFLLYLVILAYPPCYPTHPRTLSLWSRLTISRGYRFGGWSPIGKSRDSGRRYRGNWSRGGTIKLLASSCDSMWLDAYKNTSPHARHLCIPTA